MPCRKAGCRFGGRQATRNPSGLGAVAQSVRKALGEMGAKLADNECARRSSGDGGRGGPLKLS